MEVRRKNVESGGYSDFAGVLRRTIGDGLLTAERNAHWRQKRMLTPVFYKERIQQYADIVVEETARAIYSPVILPFGVPGRTVHDNAPGLFRSAVVRMGGDPKQAYRHHRRELVSPSAINKFGTQAIHAMTAKVSFGSGNPKSTDDSGM